MKTGKSILIATAMLANAASMCAQLTWASKDIHYASDYALPNQLTNRHPHSRMARRTRRRCRINPHTTGTDRGVLSHISPAPASASFVDYVLTDDFRNCGIHPDTLPLGACPHNRHPAGSVPLSGETRPVG